MTATITDVWTSATSKIPTLLMTKSITPKTLAFKVDISNDTAYRLINGDLKMNLTTFLKVCDFLGVSPNEALERNADAVDEHN